MKRRYLDRFLEFFIVGVLMGVMEDLLAVRFATDATISPKVIFIIVLVAIPFAAFSELIVDRKHFKFLKKINGKLK